MSEPTYGTYSTGETEEIIDILGPLSDSELACLYRAAMEIDRSKGESDVLAHPASSWIWASELLLPADAPHARRVAAKANALLIERGLKPCENCQGYGEFHLF